MVLDSPNEAKPQREKVTEQEKIPPHYVAKQFAHQYYNVLNMNPDQVHRFYSYNSTLVLEDDEEPSVGQMEIQKRFSQSALTHCSTRIYAIHGLETLSNGVVAQVIGEMSLPGKPMRYFTQTFVLEQQTAHKYYISNDIFCFLDSAKANSLWPMPAEGNGNGCCELDDDGVNICEGIRLDANGQAIDEQDEQKDGTSDAANDVLNNQDKPGKEDEKPVMGIDPVSRTEIASGAPLEEKEADKSPLPQTGENVAPKEANCEEQTTWATIVKTPSEKQEIDSHLKSTAECRALQKNLHPSAAEQLGRNESLTSDVVEAPQNQIFVGNLPEDIKEIDLKNCFKAYGKVTNVIIRSKRILQMGRDGGLAVYAFIAFAEKESVTRVLSDSQNVLVRGHIRVNIQLRRSPQPPRLRYGEGRNEYRDGRNTGGDLNNRRPPFKAGMGRYGQTNGPYLRNGSPCNVGLPYDVGRRGRGYISQRGRCPHYPT